MKMLLALALVSLLFSTVARAQPAPQYYEITDLAKAQAEARERNLPLAWVGGYHEDLTDSEPEHGSEAELTQMAMTCLQGQAVVIFFEGSNMAPVPAIVHAQYHMADDGPLPGGASWRSPKIVFTNPEMTRTLGRVSRTQMESDRESAINAVLQRIGHDAATQPASGPTWPSTPGTDPALPGPAPVKIISPDAPSGAETADSPSSNEPAASTESTEPAGPEETNSAGMDNEDLDISPEERVFWAWFRKNGIYAGFGMMIFLVCAMALTKKEP